jgi:hypothetical protein
MTYPHDVLKNIGIGQARLSLRISRQTALSRLTPKACI